MMLSEITSIREFHEEVISEEMLIMKMMDEGIIQKTMMCDKCEKPMKLRKRKDTFEWRCRDTKNKDCSCRSVKALSFFQNAKLSMKDVICIIVLHLNKYKNKQICEETKISKKTCVDYRNFIRELSARINEKSPKIGGGDGIVEVDESCVHSRKYSRGEVKSKLVWIFGGKDRNSGRVFAQIVEDRSARTLIPIMKKKIEADSRIYSDQWKGYNREVGNFFNDHCTVNHSVQFKSADGVHTNGIEGFWGVMKKPLKEGNGTSNALLASYIEESIARFNEKENFRSAIFAGLRTICEEKKEEAERKKRSCNLNMK